VWHGVGCQIRRQAGHGAAQSLATHLAAGFGFRFFLKVMIQRI